MEDHTKRIRDIRHPRMLVRCALIIIGSLILCAAILREFVLSPEPESFEIGDVVLTAENHDPQASARRALIIVGGAGLVLAAARWERKPSTA